MKLYTEEQVSVAINAAKANPEQAYLILAMLTPINLPSDEEILKESDEFELNSRVSLGMHISFELGAKWMRDKIQGGNQ